MERVGRNLLIQLLSLRHSPASTLSSSIHAQYFGHLWKVPVPGRIKTASTQATDWADTIAIWINPRGTRANNLGFYGTGEEAVGDPTQEAENDADSQKAGLTLIRLLRSEPAGVTKDKVWQDFIYALSASGDLLIALNRSISHPLSEDVTTLSMQGVESVYRELEKTHWDRPGQR